jgi:hypothetical protein
MVLQYDRLSYKPLSELVDENCRLHDLDGISRSAAQAAVWATVTCVLGAIGPDTARWLEQRARWHAWPLPAVERAIFFVERHLQSLEDSAGASHDNLVCFLAEAIDADRAALPRELAAALDATSL